MNAADQPSHQWRPVCLLSKSNPWNTSASSSATANPAYAAAAVGHVQRGVTALSSTVSGTASGSSSCLAFNRIISCAPYHESELTMQEGSRPQLLCFNMRFMSWQWLFFCCLFYSNQVGCCTAFVCFSRMRCCTDLLFLWSTTDLVYASLPKLFPSRYYPWWILVSLLFKSQLYIQWSHISGLPRIKAWERLFTLDSRDILQCCLMWFRG